MFAQAILEAEHVSVSTQGWRRALELSGRFGFVRGRRAH